MTRIETTIACITGFVAAVVKYADQFDSLYLFTFLSDQVNLIKLISVFITGFTGAAGGWVFTKGVSFIIKKIKKK